MCWQGRRRSPSQHFDRLPRGFPRRRDVVHRRAEIADVPLQTGAGRIAKGRLFVQRGLMQTIPVRRKKRLSFVDIRGYAMFTALASL